MVVTNDLTHRIFKLTIIRIGYCGNHQVLNETNMFVSGEDMTFPFSSRHINKKTVRVFAQRLGDSGRGGGEALPEVGHAGDDALACG